MVGRAPSLARPADAGAQRPPADDSSRAIGCSDSGRVARASGEPGGERRFGAHARQHAAHIAKTLRSVGWHQSEAQIILGQAETARSALEGALLGLPDDLAEEAPARLASVAELLAQAVAEEEATGSAIVEAIGVIGREAPPTS